MVKLKIDTTPLLQIGATTSAMEKIYEDIDYAIDTYIACTQKKPYIFMNEELAYNLMDANNWYLKVEYQRQFPGKWYMPLAEFHGCKVYLDPDLEYWEVELR